MALPEILINSTIPGERVALTTLKGALTEAGLEFEIEAAELPEVLQKAGQFRILIDHEIILCEGKAEATKKVKILERGAENSAKVAHAAGASIYFILTAEGLKLSATGPGLASLNVRVMGFKESFSATKGNLYRVSEECTVTIPEGAEAGEVIGISQTAATGVCTIKSAGGKIVGPGLGEGATSIPLASQGAYVILESLGGNKWAIIAGQLDSGWIAVTVFENEWTNYGGIFFPAQYRKIANQVVLRGTIKPGKETFAAFTLPLGFRPSKASGQTVKTGVAPYCGGLAFLTNGEVAIYAPAIALAVDLEECHFWLD